MVHWVYRKIAICWGYNAFVTMKFSEAIHNTPAARGRSNTMATAPWWSLELMAILDAWAEVQCFGQLNGDFVQSSPVVFSGSLGKRGNKARTLGNPLVWDCLTGHLRLVINCVVSSKDTHTHTSGRLAYRRRSMRGTKSKA